jgi:hypothetical protein
MLCIRNGAMKREKELKSSRESFLIADSTLIPDI